MHNCRRFKEAIDEGFINKPGDMLPNMEAFSEKYFFQKLIEPEGCYRYKSLDFCPFCGEKLD